MRSRLLVAGALLPMLAGWPVGAASPEPSTATPAHVPLTVDGSIRQADLQHDSRSDLYRSPGGAVPAGTAVALRLRSAAGDLSSAEVRVTDTLTGESRSLPMARVATDPDAREHGVDYWGVTIQTPTTPTVLEYSFVAQDGQSRRYVTDDAAQDGGTGNIVRQAPTDPGWQLTVFDPAFETPTWTRGAVVYQVFPDRYANGDTANDPSPDATAGPDRPARYRQGDVYGNLVLTKGWEERPEGWCRAYQEVICEEQPLGRDFYGGDLAGITAHLDDLVARGITALYLNPIFAAPSNHRYDTSDYFTIDPDLGTQADFDALIAAAHERDIKVILDGVFNHVSSDSPWFDRMGRFDELGACESPDSPYRSWFTFRAPGPGEPSPCAPSTPGGDDTYYVSWAGFDTIPALNETPEVVELIAGEDGVVRHWLREGIDGWRLDVADDLSPELLRAIRAAAKAEDPDSIVIVEQWGDSSRWLLGDQGDSTMDYRFRRAIIGLVNGATADLDGSIDAVTPTQFANAMRGMQEDYPAAAWDALLHMVDSHDTTRILWTLTPGTENEMAKAEPAALAEGKARQALLAAIQLTFPGMASIFYGDEVGLTGHDDPDDRRPYPWGGEDEGVLDTYRSLALLRQGSEALREGDLTFLAADDSAGTLAYLRRADRQAAVVALNLADAERQLVLDVAGRLPDGTQLERPLDMAGDTLTVTDGGIRLTLPARSAAVLITAAGSDLAPPAAPSEVTAVADAGRVDLSWDAVDGAAAYQVWRSVVPDGGYQPVSTTSDAAFADTTVHNGSPAFYVVTALDDAGNVSPRSPETAALPQVTITTVSALGESHRATTRSAVGDGVPLEVRVTVAEGDSTEPTSGVVAEVGMGPPASRPDDTWVWFAAQPESADRWLGHVRPEELGTFALAVRASADGGRSWVVGTGPGITLDVVPSADVQAPAPPAELRLVDVGDDHVTIGWSKVAAEDIQRYVVYRSGGDTPEPVRIATTVDPVYADTSVVTGARYHYEVTAQDLAFNESPPSPALTIEAAERIVQVTFRVSVPANTPTTDSLFIAGDFQGWAPGQTPMERIDERTWSITLPFEDGTSIEYKYTRGSWEAVEKDDGCGEIANRTMTADFGASQEQVIEDVVDKWRDVDGCG